MPRASLSQIDLSFMCPGCGERHVVTTDRWSWNGDLELPTVEPSILVRGYRPLRGRIGYTPEEMDELDELRGRGIEAVLSSRFGTRCHSYVRLGRIEFLPDCTHSLAGQTVDLPSTG